MLKTVKMYVKSLLLIPCLVLLLLSITCVQNTKVPVDLNQKPSWLKERPIVLVGSWDSEPILQRRWGELAVEYLGEYYRRHSEETVKKMKELGITCVITHFFKGFGIEAEREYMDDTKKFTALCHKYDIKVGVYVGDTICYETFLKENPFFH